MRPLTSTSPAVDAPEPAEGWEAYRGRGYFPELDGLRALSILLVVAHHMHDKVWGWLNGPLGVTIFFVLSGYLITTLALREERTRGDLCFSAFYIRRSFRIFPAYYVTLGLYCLTILGLGIKPESRELLMRALPYYLSYLQEIPFFRGIGGNFNIPFVQSWSLGVEEKFYLVWPLLAFWIWRGDGRSRVSWTAALTVAFAAAPALEYAGLGLLGRMIVPHSRILVGCLVALLLDDPSGFGRLSFLGRGGWPWATTAVLVGLHVGISDGDPVGHASYAIACGTFLVGLLCGGGAIRRALAWAPLVALGRLSYGVYLLHFFGLNAAEKLVRPGSGRIEVAAVTLVLAWATSAALAYALALVVERPCIALGRRL